MPLHYAAGEVESAQTDEVVGREPEVAEAVVDAFGIGGPDRLLDPERAEESLPAKSASGCRSTRWRAAASTCAAPLS